MGVLGEGTNCSSGTFELLRLSINGDQHVLTLRNLISPFTALLHLVVSKAGRTLVTVSLAVNTLVKDAAAFGVSVCTIQSGTVGRGDGGLEFCPTTTLHEVQLCTLFEDEAVVSVNEAEAVAASLQLGNTILTVPVLITTETRK